jgi:hypothetical protein
MSNHAALIRAENAGKPVLQRGRDFIDFDLGGGKKQRVFTIDKLHYGAAYDQEVDTTWITSVDPAWQWQLLENDFHVHARNLLNAGDLIQWLDTRSGESVIVDPQSINWVDNVTDSRQQIATKQAVGATTEDAKITWVNGYGMGRHFRYTAHPKRLIKHVIIDALANLPAPTVQNPYFEIEFVIKKSAGVTLYVDGQPWDNSTKTATTNEIEFRLTDGTVAWYFAAPIAEDSARDTSPGIFQVRRQGNTRFCTVRFPKAWIDAAVFPIYIDDTFTDGYGGDVTTYKDDMVLSSAAENNYGVADYSGGRSTLYKGLMEFDLSSIDADATCDSATLYRYASAPGGGGGAFTATMYSIASGNAAWIEGTKNGTTAGSGEPCWEALAADGSGGVTTAWAGSAGLATSGTDYEATAIGTFNGQNNDANGTEYTATLTTSRVEDWFGASNTNYGILTVVSAAATRLASSDNATTGYRPKLVVVYTAAAGGRTTKNTDSHPLGIQAGISRRVGTF